MRQAALYLVLILLVLPAQAQDTPKRKSGLWEIKWTSARAEGRSRDMQMCVDQATDNPLLHLNEATRKETCETNKLKRDGEQITVDAVCTLGKTTATSHAVITGKFDSAYKVEVKSTYEPPLRGKTEGSASHEARWVGPCAPDQKPGDVILASGKKFNVNDRTNPSANATAAGKTGPGASSGKRPTGQPTPPSSFK